MQRKRSVFLRVAGRRFGFCIFWRGVQGPLLCSHPGGLCPSVHPSGDSGFGSQGKQRGAADRAGATLREPPRQLARGPCAPQLRRGSRTRPAEKDSARVNVSSGLHWEQARRCSHQWHRAHAVGEDACPPPSREHHAQQDGARGGRDGSRTRQEARLVPGPVLTCTKTLSSSENQENYSRFLQILFFRE